MYTIKTYKTLTETVVCNDHVKHLKQEGVYTQLPKTANMSGFYAHCSVQNNFSCFYVPRKTLVFLYEYNDNIKNNNLLKIGDISVLPICHLITTTH